MDVQELLALAREKSKQHKSTLATAINDLYGGDAVLLTERERRIMEDIIRLLIHDVEISVRRTLSQHFARQSDAPHDLVLMLANDRIEVAHPILFGSEVLRDEELVDIVQHRTMEHQVAISQRPSVSERVSDALADTENPVVIEALLKNGGARISERTMGRVVEASRDEVRYQLPLVHRRDLPTDLAKRLYWCVSAALREHIATNYPINEDELDDFVESATKEALEAKKPEDGHGAASEPGRDDAQSCENLKTQLRGGSIFQFLKEFNAVSGLRMDLLRRILFEPGGASLAIVCKAVGLKKRDFGRALLAFRQGRLGAKDVDPREVNEALAFYDQVGDAEARRVLRRWKREEGYQSALEILAQIRDGTAVDSH